MSSLRSLLVESFRQLNRTLFFNEILIGKLSAQEIVVGYDFAFGKERHGHLDALGRFCRQAGVRLDIVQPIQIEGAVVSSSRIRQHLRAGELAEAKNLMGRPFFYRGIVIRGEGRGRKMGFPTANLQLADKLTLPYGVYATWVVRKSGVGTSDSGAELRYPSVTNIGSGLLSK
jgi:riboflavin kinase/FMN adenylyltransferase